MSDLKKIWNPIEIFTNSSKLLLVEMQSKKSDIKIDYAWGKVIGDGEILFEFNLNEATNYSLLGTIKGCIENPEILESFLDKLPKYEECWDIPNGDKDGWEAFAFVDEMGKGYKQMGRDMKYRRIIGYQYINYGIPKDVMEYFPLQNPVDSFITLLRGVGIYPQNNDFFILKDLKYEVVSGE